MVLLEVCDITVSIVKVWDSVATLALTGILVVSANDDAILVATTGSTVLAVVAAATVPLALDGVALANGVLLLLS
jgi:hypothetical protein